MINTGWVPYAAPETGSNYILYDPAKRIVELSSQVLQLAFELAEGGDDREICIRLVELCGPLGFGLYDEANSEDVWGMFNGNDTKLENIASERGGEYQLVFSRYYGESIEAISEWFKKVAKRCTSKDNNKLIEKTCAINLKSMLESAIEELIVQESL